MDNVFCFLNIYKPEGITSFDVIYKLRKILNIKKIGHSGTLDPMADGVLQIGINKASKLLDYLPSDKEYIAEIQFGYTSNTLDREGEITKCETIPHFTKNDLTSILKEFIGKIEQTPPKFSAIKVQGKKLCDVARKNPEKEIEIPKRTIEIFNIALQDFDCKNYTAKILVNCSKGTYIRTLAEDIAKKLNTKAYLTKLTRTKCGNFSIQNSIKIEDVTKDNIENISINPTDAIINNKITIDIKNYNMVKNGIAINFPHNAKNIRKNEPVFLIFDNKLVSIGVLSDNKIKIKKFFG